MGVAPGRLIPVPDSKIGQALHDDFLERLDVPAFGREFVFEVEDESFEGPHAFLGKVDLTDYHVAARLEVGPLLLLGGFGGQEVVDSLDLGLELGLVLLRFAGAILKSLNSRFNIRNGSRTQLQCEDGHLQPAELDFGGPLIDQLLEKSDRLIRSFPDDVQLTNQVAGGFRFLGCHGRRRRKGQRKTNQNRRLPHMMYLRIDDPL